MARLYITYSSRDRALALQLAAQLRAFGHQIAIDVDSLVPGIEWRRELMDKLLLCDGVVVLLTANAVGSPFVFSEIGSARASSRRFLIPVIVGDLPIHPVVQDIYAIRIPSISTREVRKAVKKIDEAVTAHLRRSAALLGVTVPSGYEHLSPQVRRFCDDSPFERNVFVMMKFPTTQDAGPTYPAPQRCLGGDQLPGGPPRRSRRDEPTCRAITTSFGKTSVCTSSVPSMGSRSWRTRSPAN